MLVREKEIFFEKILILLNAEYSINRVAVYILDKKNKPTNKEIIIASAISEGKSFYSAVKKEFVLSAIEDTLISAASTENEIRNVLYNLKNLKNKTVRLLLQIGLLFFLMGVIITAGYYIFNALLYKIIPNTIQFFPELINEKITFILTNIKKILPLLFNGGIIILLFLFIVTFINPIFCENIFLSLNISISKVRKYALLNQFFWKLYLLCSNGINLKESLEITYKNERNYFQTIIKEVYNNISSGKQLNKSFENTKKNFFPMYVIKIATDMSDNGMNCKNFKHIAALSELDFYNAGIKLITNSIILVVIFIIFFIISAFLLGFLLLLMTWL